MKKYILLLIIAVSFACKKEEVKPKDVVKLKWNSTSKFRGWYRLNQGDTIGFTTKDTTIVLNYEYRNYQIGYTKLKPSNDVVNLFVYKNDILVTSGSYKEKEYFFFLGF